MEKLDLHHRRHHEVKELVIRFIEAHWNSNENVEIITGDSKKMKALVKEVIGEYRLEYDEKYCGKGRIIVNM